MKIKSVGSSQFAGIRNKNIAFTDGINIIYGENETGKSTIVNLISRTLFQKAKLDKRTDKDFLNLYFPVEKRDGSERGDFIDGRIELEADDGAYTLKKEWGEEPLCRLSSPSAEIKSYATIKEKLENILKYGEGVYSDLLLSSQRNIDISLENLLDSSKKTNVKRELENSVTTAFAQTDGITINAIEEAIKAKIAGIEGKHWNYENNRPKSKPSGGKWEITKNDNSILRSYYYLEEVQGISKEIEKLELNVDRYTKELSEIQNKAVYMQNEVQNFSRFSNKIAIKNERIEKLDRLKIELSRLDKKSAELPKLKMELMRARLLNKEKNARELIDIYRETKTYVDRIGVLNDELIKCVIPENKDILALKKAKADIKALENKLCGMNLNAQIKMLSGNDLKVISILTGKEYDINDSNIEIREAVRIVIPNIMEMQLSPLNINIDEINSQISAQKELIDTIYTRYKVGSIEELEKKLNLITQKQNELEILKARLESILKARSFEEIEKSVALIDNGPREADKIREDIGNICGSNDIIRFITNRETLIASIEKEYGTDDEINEKLKAKTLEVEQHQAELNSIGDIPDSYKNIRNPDEHINILQKNLDEIQEKNVELSGLKAEAIARLNSKLEGIDFDIYDEVKKAENIFNEQKELLSHWKHIEKVFYAEKERLTQNPMRDIASSFTEYLGLISNNNISSEFNATDRIDMNIYTNDSLIDYDKLSEGSKETVSLAFRLAALEHLFPEGGGILVLDDPFVNMDDLRASEACRLIERCGERHQILFLTCHEEYTQKLKGNIIRL